MSDDISTYLATPINATDLKGEFDKVLGHYAFVSAALGDLEKKDLDIEKVLLLQRQNTFGEQLAAQAGKVSEAAIGRKIVEDQEWVKLRGELNTIKAAQKKLGGLKEALKMKHDACIALVNRASTELRVGSST